MKQSSSLNPIYKSVREYCAVLINLAVLISFLKIKDIYFYYLFIFYVYLAMNNIHININFIDIIFNFLS